MQACQRFLPNFIDDFCQSCGQTFMEHSLLPTANELQVAGNHYKGCKIEPWDYAIANGLPFLEGSIVKYVTRWRDKEGIRDLEKIIHYAEKLIEQARAEGFE